MTLRSIVKFFFNNLEFKDCLKIIFNYFLIFLALGLEIIFITLFFLILNQQQEFTKNVFLKEFISEFQALFGIDSSIKLYIQLLIISLVLKNLIHISQNYFFFRFIYNLTKKNAVNFFNFCLQQRY